MPKVSQAFERCNKSVVNLLVQLAKGDVELADKSKYTAADFVKEWTNGGKKFIEDYWRDSANTPTKTLSKDDKAALGDAMDTTDADDVDDAADNDRELYQGKHEWIPTNYLGYVVENGLLKHKDLGWVYLAEVLRIPTRLVVTVPSKKCVIDSQNSLGLHGHVGALYTKSKAGAYRPQFKGQATFHNELRAIVKESLSYTKSDAAAYMKALVTHIQEWYWQGDLDSVAKTYKMTATDFGKLACPYFFNSGKNEYTSWGQTMADMASKLTKDWADWNKVMQNQMTAHSYNSRKAEIRNLKSEILVRNPKS